MIGKSFLKALVFQMNKDIVIIGTGGFGREVLHLIESINNASIAPVYNVIGFLNNDSSSWGNSCNGVKIIGDETVLQFFKSPLHIAIGIGDPSVKRKVVQKLGDSVVYPNLIHPSVKISKTNSLGIGNVITEGCVLTCNLTIKNHVMINLACTVGHDTIIDDYVVVSPGVNVSGNVYIGEGSYIGTGAKILEKLTLGAWSTIGGAALINKNVNNNATVVGVPAKEIKIKNDGWQLQ